MNNKIETFKWRVHPAQPWQRFVTGSMPQSTVDAVKKNYIKNGIEVKKVYEY